MKQISITTAKDYLPLCAETIKHYIDKGEIKGYIGTHRVLIDEDSFHAFVERHTSYENPKFLQDYYENKGKKIEIRLPGGVDKWITMREARTVLPLSYTAIRNLIKDRKITACVLDNRIFIKESSFLRHIAISTSEVDPKFLGNEEEKKRDKILLQMAESSVSVLSSCAENEQPSVAFIEPEKESKSDTIAETEAENTHGEENG